jgi:hypothetical protein
MFLIDQILDFFTNNRIGQIITSTLGSGGIVSLWFKKRSDQEIERLKKQLEIYYFNETLGKTRADDQQSAAIKKIWDTITDWVFELQSFVKHAQSIQTSGDNSNVVGSLTRLPSKLKAMEIELNKFAIHIDLETYDSVMDAYTQLCLFFEKNFQSIINALQQAIVDTPNDLNKINEVFPSAVAKFDIQEINLILGPLAQLMRKKLKVIDNSERRQPSNKFKNWFQKN